ncbi:MAG: hypothetical protein UY71_C0007G0010 [Parcubacteria group bacterium GW2011_GWB1_52_7]|nr:MAG: hypothetical protein UY64_C0010G0015 [Parcubacteria group bacterium GW2011_GWA1_51_12]KKW28926.1 MAG: hypothetical protein UY71_C0007G0010 [Parcubacteria group bacterium GW2011_GWB1_52_7]KKW30930.1 MAG: hypothetical protein UY75_C0021G0010 [Parcubacteria group bacterium GW2011_GWC2_52_8c]
MAYIQLKYLKRFAEFFVIGMVFNVADNLLSITTVSDTVITPKVIGIIFLLTIPFAIISELVVDGKDIFGHRKHLE